MTRSVPIVAQLVGMAGILLVAAAGRGRGAADAARSAREHARSHIGPFYITPTLTLEELGVDTNVFNEPESDERCDLHPGAARGCVGAVRPPRARHGLRHGRADLLPEVRI